MSLYDDFFARANIGDEAFIPRKGTLTHSPDIQPAGTKLIDDPQDYFIGRNGAQYDVDRGTSITARSRNYIYVRGASALSTEGVIELYFVPSSLLMHPNGWSKNQLKDEKGNTSIPFKALNNQRIVLSTPFVWDNPIPDQHYCLVSRIVTKRHPNPIPTSLAGWDSFYEWLKESPGIGWRNISIVNSSLPTSTATTDLHIPQEWDSHDALVYLETIDIPNGVTVSFSSSNIDPPFKLEPQKITHSPQRFYVFTKLNSGTMGKVTYTYNRNGIQVPDNAKLVLNVVKLSQIGSVTTVFKRE
ncbi:9023_t:CDS:1 [Paraglomus brasilianum]|uniref:9023_t:CDS:1 n=1 Tax=Paraglomus brasilianum TaxID=144538 RepID=A0A9N9F7I6_9GLOM|nr:9023_t:CDS:1 [Paraglomus brasilianum]